VKRLFRYGDDTLVLEIDRSGDTVRVRLPDGSEHTLQTRRLPGGTLEIATGERIFRVPVVRDPGVDTVTLTWDGGVYVFAADTEEKSSTGRPGAARRSGILTAPMVGIVADIRVAVGDTVALYQPVASVEAMKVLATLEAPFAGTVSAVHVRKGERVEHGAPLVEIAPESTPEEEMS